MNALGDPTRRAIFERLADGPVAVGELARDSQHLRVLKEAGLVVDEQVGTRRLYRLDPHGVDGLRTYFDRFWNKALTAFKAAAEQPSEEEQ